MQFRPLFGLFPWYLLIAVLSGLFGAATARAAPAAEPLRFDIGYIYHDERRLTLSVLDLPPEDDGIAGARLAVADNNTTGRFLGQEFVLHVEPVGPGGDPMAAFEKLHAAGARYIVTDLPAEATLRVADAGRDRGVLVFNAGALDDSLRNRDCRANVFHVAPSRAMLADGLAQYLVWKQWRDWFLIVGSHEADELWATALRRAAKRFGAKIVEERIFEDTGGARQTDSGVVQIQRRLPVFTQGAAEHDVVVAADESDVFATYLPFRTWVPRPVAGSAGLVPASWDESSEQWGGAQIQNRFADANGRRMRPKDMQAWTAVRIIGEAATRTRSADSATLARYILSPEFTIAAFKGQRLTFRDWNQQLRQPVLLSDSRIVVSVSPQEGFLHQVSELDTLGLDRPESECNLSRG